MKFLIIYGTTEGQTKKIAERAGEQISKAGHEAELVDSEHASVSPDWSSCDAVVLAGSIHQERHQDSLINFVIAHRDRIQPLPSALISVSLSAATEEGRPAAEGYVERLSWITKFEPSRTLLLAGALRYSKYEYFKVEIVKHIVSKTTGDFAPTGDHEFTDWEELSRFVDSFLVEVGSGNSGGADAGG